MEDIRTIDRVIMKAPKIVLVTLVTLGIVVIPSSFLWALVILGAAGMFLYVCLRKIPYRPPYVGVVIIWGRRIPAVKKEGWHLFASFPPFMYTVTMIKVEKINLDFVFSDIRCKAREEPQEKPQGGKQEEKLPYAGGEISVNISLTYCPDYRGTKAGERLISFINSGGHEGVKNIIRDLIQEDIREMARSYSWEAVTFAGEEIKKRLVKKLTGEELTEETEKELNTNGLPDVADLGIRISRFNVGKVKEQGELAKAAESFAKETQQRRGEKVELKFVQEQTQEFIRLGVSPGEALDAIQVERGKAGKNINAIRGLDTVAEAFGVGFGALLRKTKAKKKS